MEGGTNFRRGNDCLLPSIYLFFLRWQSLLTSLSVWSSPPPSSDEEEEEELESEEEEEGRPVSLVRSTLSARSASDGWCSCKENSKKEVNPPAILLAAKTSSNQDWWTFLPNISCSFATEKKTCFKCRPCFPKHTT